MPVLHTCFTWCKGNPGMPWRHSGGVVLVFIFSSTCRDTRVWCYHRQAWSTFLSKAPYEIRYPFLQLSGWGACNRIRTPRLSPWQTSVLITPPPPSPTQAPCILQMSYIKRIQHFHTTNNIRNLHSQSTRRVPMTPCSTLVYRWTLVTRSSTFINSFLFGPGCLFIYLACIKCLESTSINSAWSVLIIKTEPAVRSHICSAWLGITVWNHRMDYSVISSVKIFHLKVNVRWTCHLMIGIWGSVCGTNLISFIL